MHRWKASILLVILAAVSLAQTASQLQTEPVRRVGARLACLCGSCNNTVAECQMLECHFSKPARVRIAALQAMGKSDSEIIDEFVAQYGKQVLAAPPAEGFNLLAWVMPFAAIGAGLAAIWLFIRRIKKPAAVPVDDEDLSRYRERIEKDLTKLD
jgi:cytochrome c-type biogenesis protein CcmH